MSVIDETRLAAIAAQAANLRRKHKVRLKARQHMPELLARHNSRCQWCGREVVRVKGNLEIQSISNGRAWVRRDGKVIRLRVATIDHLKGTEAGNGEENLVLSCQPCNVGRVVAEARGLPFPSKL